MDVEQARPPAIMWVSKPMTRPDRRACLRIIPIPAAAHAAAPTALAPDQCRSLLDHLAQLADPRQRRGRRHALSAVLAVAACAVLAGARSLAAIGEWAADAPGQVLAALGVRRDPLTGAFRPPAEATVRRVLARVDPDALDQTIGAWLAGQQLLPPTRPPPAPRPRRQAVAVDGKSLRGSGHHHAAPVHLLAAMDHANGWPPWTGCSPRQSGGATCSTSRR
ncbi:MAG TPA: transposase family protein [Actinomycetes bacterium]